MKRVAVESFKIYLTILEAVDKGTDSPSALAEKLGMYYTSLKTYLDDLQTLGLIRVENVKSARARLKIVLTEKGKCFLKCFTS